MRTIPSSTSSAVRFSTFPRTQRPPDFVPAIVDVFRTYESTIGTRTLTKGLTSDVVLAAVADGLTELGFQIEKGKLRDQKIDRPVFFGENGEPSLRYQIDAFHPKWKCGLEVEAGRAWMGNAVYRDLVQACVMVDVEHLVLAVSLGYRYRSGGRNVISNDYANTVGVADALYSHTRVKLPYSLAVIGY
jgi:hypothetical protein